MEYSALSDIGLKRDKNEDNWNIVLNNDGQPVGFIVADGMGGYIAGEEASRIAVEQVSSLVLDCIALNSVAKMRNIMTKRIKAINESIMAYSVKELGGLKSGTTLSMGIVKGDTLYIAHIGDSRVYQVRNNSIRLVTTDHSYVAELVKEGLLTVDQASNHPDKNKITRALGFKDSYMPDFYEEGIQPGDVYIFCTDGLYEHLADHEILEVISSETTEDAARRLIALANKRGGNDNITVIIAKM